jgi:hypothetical protein
METACRNGHMAEGGERFCQQCGELIDRPPVGSPFQEVDRADRPPPHDLTTTRAAPSVTIDPVPRSVAPTGPGGAPLGDKPSIAPTLLVTIFFGLVGLWPAIRHGRMARDRGLSSGRYWWAFGIPVVGSLLFTVATAIAAGSATTAVVLPTVTPATAPTTPVTTPVNVPATTPPTSPATIPASTVELEQWAHAPDKCGPIPGANNNPYDVNLQYYVTGTIHVWSGPSTSSTPIDIIPVNTYGTGGIGCPSDIQPQVQVVCKSAGTAITGPFSTETWWDQIRWKGATGYVPDEWINTQGDIANGTIPPC